MWTLIATYVVYVLLLLLLVQVVSFLCYTPKTRAIWKSLENIPAPKGYFFGNTHHFFGDQQHVWEKRCEFGKKYPDGYRLRMFNYMAITTSKPENIELVLSNSRQNTKSPLYSLLEPWLGTGLLTSSGEKWKLRRRILTPSFHFNIIERFTEIFDRNAKQAVKRLEAEEEKPFTDATYFVTEFAFHSLCETTLGVAFDRHNERFNEYKNAVEKAVEVVIYQLPRLWSWNPLFYYLTYKGYVFRKNLKVLKKFTGDILDERLKNWQDIAPFSETTTGRKLYPMMDLLIWQMKNGENIDREGIQEELDTFMFEGQDTTASGMSFLAMLLANHKEVQDKIYEELREVIGDQVRELGFKDFQSLPYLEMCIKEGLRHYPPVHFISRTLNEDITLVDGTRVPVGTFFDIEIFNMHHDPAVWPDPEKFIPERFLPENTAKRSPFAYLPFSAGSRNCIGQKFALNQMKALFANILYEYEILPIDSPSTLKFRTELVIRATTPVRIKFQKR